ncbi:DUF4288 domain-containing protein [Dyella choica]|uniref:DUF4288 domain-containing protein n=1 Tax=Dyella choica TaxID=1927959 RepID=A0A3S0WVD5_9GAMM|nr:DUF4288 domain-containing protein [Dyella choica]RUL74566.1 DUF4288 domain-containing protein [Dyella choica]
MNNFIFHTYMVGRYYPEREDVWEENIRIYKAVSLEAARSRAMVDATADEIVYQTADGYELSWKVYSISLIKELIDDALDGVEVFSRSLLNNEAKSLQRKIEP